MIKTEISEHKPDEGGNYIERNLAEVEKSKNDPNHVFHGEIGMRNMLADILDLFMAGKP